MASSLPYTLSAEDAALFKVLQDSAILQDAAKPGEGSLVQLFKQNKKEEQKKFIQPYADILEAQLKVNLWDRKDEILAELKASESSRFSAELFSWNSVQYRESLSDRSKRLSAMGIHERRSYNQKMMDRHQRIKENDWETEFCVKTRCTYEDWGGELVESDTYSWFPVKVDRIFRNSDLDKRLSLALGPNFYPYIAWELIEGASDDDDDGFQVYKKTLCVRYYPFGVAKLQMDKLLETAREQAKRKSEGRVYTLGYEETPYGHTKLFLDKDEYADMPPLIPARRAERCFCGCEEDDE